ncbi:MAG: inorganic phosphate transporter [Paracoccus sp. (in: a-proteobacteria)]|uniref:inorganic phosphate transporter n=1 Tax=Paracoccus sp. TaxID=267 RepID=UPI0039E54BA4
MPRGSREYRVLDKDLERLNNAEYAALAQARPRVRLGIALVFVATAAEIAATLIAGQPALGIVAGAVAIAVYMALSIGANDVANALSPAVGAGAIRLGLGLWLVAGMEILGAVIAGAAVTSTLTGGLVAQAGIQTGGMQGGGIHGGGQAMALVMLAALTSAATTISLATWLDAPISTTHALVGAITGAGMTAFGVDAVNWSGLALVAVGWVVSPLVSGCLAAALLSIVQSRVLDRADPVREGGLWLTVIVGLVAAMLFGVAARAFAGLGTGAVLGLAAGGGLLGGLYADARQRAQIARQIDGRKAVKRLLGVPLVFAAMVMGFAHGANDVSNIAAPLTVILKALPQDAEGALPVPPRAILAIAGLGIGMGMLLFGGRLVMMVGSSITRLNPARGLCVTLAAAMTVLGFSVFGMPVSTTHIAVGGVFGVGFYREWHDRRMAKARPALPGEEVHRRHLVRRSYLRTILGAWLVTVPLNALLSAALVWLLRI